MDIPVYVLCNLMCIAIMTILCYQSSLQYKIIRDERIFLEVMLISVIMFLSDINWFLVEGQEGKLFRFINVVSNGSYLLMTALMGFTLLIYVDLKYCKRTEVQASKRFFIYSLPLIAFMLLLATSQFSHLVFYVDANNNYQRGPLYIVQVAVAMFYVIYATILARMAARYIHRSRAVRKETFSLSAFSLMALGGGLVQMMIPTLPVLSMTLTVSILFIYLNVQSKQIYIDTLCGINNRRQFNIYIESVLNTKKKKKGDLYLLMMDIDKFKEINDTYGHTEGDFALINVAEILARVCARHDDFTARYGGDEFAIVCYRKEAEEVEGLKADILEEIKVFNETSEKPYKVSVSIGSARLEYDQDTESAINKADEQLYQIKAARESVKAV